LDHSVDVDGDTPAALGGRDLLGMTGTKFGCGMALCGACMSTASASRARGSSAWWRLAIEQASFGQSARAGARRGDPPVSLRRLPHEFDQARGRRSDHALPPTIR
jgi:hypothetical protein